LRSPICQRTLFVINNNIPQHPKFGFLLKTI
jgi:hypothetical protein